MVSGVKSNKGRRSGSVKISYIIHIDEIKPWPPSQSLRSLRSVLIQWENGERYSGSTSHVVPSLGSDSEEGKIEFNESFRLPVTMLRDMSFRGGHADVFQKNCLEFNLYEPRRDKSLKGQSLATAIVDLADYGIIKEALSISVPLNCKRNYKNTDQPLLFIKIQPFDKSRANSLSKDNLLQVNGGDSTLMNGEYAEEAEISVFSDDDVSSHSSVAAVAPSLEANRCMPVEPVENGSTQNTNKDDKEHLSRLVKTNMMPQDTYQKLERSSSSTSSLDMSSDIGSPVNGHASSNSTNFTPVTPQKYAATPNAYPSPKLAHDELEADSKIKTRHSGSEHSDEEIHDKVVSHLSTVTDVQMQSKIPSAVNCDGSEVNGKFYNGDVEDKHATENSSLDNKCSTEIEQSAAFGAKDNAVLSSNSHPLGGANVIRSERLKHAKSVRSPADSTRIAGSLGSHHNWDVKEIGIDGDVQNKGGNIRSSDRKDAKIYPREARMTILDSKVEHLENKIKILEGELREVAAIEASLYSVVAEHGSSLSKVHAPARRLSRLYLHACKENLQARRAGAAKNAVSGLVLVAKACGNDVPRLTFWLSNIIVLRTIICQASKDIGQSVSTESSVKRKIEGERNGKTTLSLRWMGSSPGQNETTVPEHRGFSNWDQPHAFTSALEKVEAWIFSRIVESIWWQSLIPHMQSDAIATKKDMDKEQGNISLDIWKKAFRESWDRLCPIRAGGHECGCLPVLSRLIMEQCVTRLDLAMFNAILRESADEMPTDPVSDPISDPNVLPISPGQLSFGAGAQLKTAIGNWSRWLTDLFGMDDDDTFEDIDGPDDNDGRQNTSLKSFHLLNALSDLLMLPKDMLLSSSVRKEVCPKFSSPLIKRILDIFVADEFCPDPIPTAVFEALDSEDDVECDEECVRTFPCNAAPVEYIPPPATSIVTIIGEVGSERQLRKSRSSVMRKAHTSDDELDELNSPLSSLLSNVPTSLVASIKPSWRPKETLNVSTVRYELLRDVWMSSE